MIYLVTTQKELFNQDIYKVIPFNDALNILYKIYWIQLDTETTGLDCFTKRLLTIQLGNKQNQIVFDWSTLTDSDKEQLKQLLESTEHVFIGWNLLFDLRFLYINNIYPNNVWDGMLAEKLLYLGYKSGQHEMSLKAAAKHYLNYDLDKTVRGKIINVGLTPEVVKYAAGDVELLEDIKNAQEKELTKEDLLRAVKFENEFLPCMAYIAVCGVKLDINKWRAKMAKDQAKMDEAKQALDSWVVQWCKDNPDKSMGQRIEYVEVYNPDKLRPFEQKQVNALLGKKYSYDATKNQSNNLGCIEMAFVKNGTSLFTDINYQGNLFTGFNLEPQCSINWSSSKQVIPFFKLLGFKLKTLDKKTKRYRDSVSSKLIETQLDVSPIAKIYLQYIEAHKIVTTYGQNWLNAINPVTGRVHPEFNQIGTDTARLSSGGGPYKLNGQNIPHDAETRACFVAEKGNKFISADYAGQESQLIASVSNDEAMIDLFTNGCGDRVYVTLYGNI